MKDAEELMASEVVRIKASAGAGKTYRLSLRYLELLKRYGDLKSIVAITFTNKAAQEMKERILFFLKELALQVGRYEELKKELDLGEKASEWAEGWVDCILENYTDFQVRTIDSLLYSILKALSFELGLSSELDVVFDQSAIFEEAFERFLSEIGGNCADLCKRLLSTYFDIDDRGGFYPEWGIRFRLSELLKENLSQGVSVLSEDDPEFRRTVEELRKGLGKIAVSLANLKEKIRVKGNPLKVAYENFISTNFQQISVKELAKAGELVMNPVSPEEFFDGRKVKVFPDLSGIEKMIRELRGVWDRFCRYYAVLRVSAYVEALSVVRRYMDVICLKEGIIRGGEDWIELVGRKLKEKGVVPLVFAFFGARFSHFLFDEFQDTSRRQWETLFPLVEEALSKGGSFFFVGDVKQAIYRWRGGDWSLFDEVWEKGVSPSASGNCREQVLDGNFRSAPSLISFFNELFKPFSSVKEVEKLVEEHIGEEKAKRETAVSIARAYKNHFQKPMVADAQGVVVKVRLFKHSKKAGVEPPRDRVKREFLSLLKECFDRNPSGIAVLLRRNKEVEEVSRWLLEEGIPVVTENALKMDSSFVVRGLLNALSYVHRRDKLSLYGLLASGIVRGISFDDGRWYRDKEALKKEIEERLAKCFPYSSVYQLLHTVFESLGVAESLGKELERHMPFIERLFEVAHLFDLNNPPLTGSFLELWEEGRLEGRVGLPEDIEAVWVMTVHKAKGLEFPVVFVPFTNWRVKENVHICRLEDFEVGKVKGSFLAELGADGRLDDELLHIKYLEVGRKLQEELNLFYVALTRAKNELYLFVTDPRRDNIAGVISKLPEVQECLKN